MGFPAIWNTYILYFNLGLYFCFEPPVVLAKFGLKLAESKFISLITFSIDRFKQTTIAHFKAHFTAYLTIFTVFRKKAK